MNFDRIVDKFPSERAAIIRLRDLLEHTPGYAEFTLNHLSSLVQPKRTENLAAALGELIREGEVKGVIRVVSPQTQGGIADFDSLNKIPPTIHDFRTDTEIEVKPENLRFVYVVHAKDAANR